MLPGLPIVPKEVNGLPVILTRPATMSSREICDVIICRRGEEYIVWTYNRQTGGPNHGSYDNGLMEALDIFAKRHTEINKAWWNVRSDVITQAESWIISSHK